jgi:molybdate/tungstate transport system substrate-binding protein
MPRATIGLLLLAVGCADNDTRSSPTRDTLTVFEAASLAGPMRAVLDTFARRSGAVVLEEHGASLELARRVTELRRVPDVIALADREVFPELLIPSATSWYANFARNRMVVAYTRRSRHAAEVTADNWRSILLRPDVLLGRTDPALAPAGYRALLVFRLAESFYKDSGLAKRLETRTPPRLLRGNAAELAALLAAGELDYIIDYESLARAQHFSFIALPAAIDLGDPAKAATYATASVRVRSGHDSITRRGEPILYGVSVPRRARHFEVGVRFLQFMLGAEGQAILRRAHVDFLEHPEIVGDSVPAGLREVTR